MAGFRFSFVIDDCSATEQNREEEEEVSYHVKESVEHLPDMDNTHRLLSKVATKELDLPNSAHKLYHIRLDSLKRAAEPTTHPSRDALMELVDETNTSHSDLLPGRYEGGLKVWECTHDLLTHLSESKFDFRDKLVLDLGCGAGLLGIRALLGGAKSVHFQDYNEEVINYMTVPNVAANAKKSANISDSLSFNRCRFFSGDWESFAAMVDCKYDVVLTSETIYSTQSQPRLIRALAKLVATHGVILLAAKMHYFGVGGTIGGFLTLLSQRDDFKTVVVSETNTAIKRQILQITRSVV